MSNDGVDQSRRMLLIGATAVSALPFAGAAVVPFVKSWNPSAKAKAAGAPVTIDISKLEMGQRIVIEWRGKPVFLVRRSQEALANLAKNNGSLRDPSSEDAEQQPGYAQNPHRSINPEVLVLVGTCTHLGCSPLYRPEVAPADLGADWLGGFFCPCHGSKFDLAGRVFQNVPAAKNLAVPPHSYTSDSVIVIGVDKEHAA